MSNNGIGRGGTYHHETVDADEVSRITLVLSPEDRARVEHIERLVRSGDRAAPELLDLLAEPSWAVRRAVVSALASIGEAAVPGLVSVLEANRNNEARLAAAVDALVATRGASFVETLMLEVTQRPDAPPALICDAVQVLGRRRAHSAVPRLNGLSRHEDDNVAVASIEALGRIGGSETVEALILAVESRHFFRTFPAIDALGRTGDLRAVAPLTALLADPLYAPEAIRGLGHTGHESAVKPLAALLLKPTDAVVRTAAVALAELRERYEARFGDTLSSTTSTMTRALAEAVSPSDASARLARALPGVAPSELVAIARVFGWLGDSVAIDQLVILSMQEPPIGPAASDALRRLGGRATAQLLDRIATSESYQRLRLLPLVGYTFERVHELVDCLRDSDPDVRVLACEALARAGNPQAVSTLFTLIGDRDTRVSQAAAAAIQSLGSLETKRLALEQARSTDTCTKRAALRIISYFGFPEGLDVLIESLANEDEKIREAAIYGLPLLEDPRGTAALIGAAKHPLAKTRGAVMRALGQTQSKAASVVNSLRAGLADPDPWVRYYACQALGKLRIEDAETAIIECMNDKSGQVKIAAVEALARLSGDRAAAALDEAARTSDPDLRRAALVGLGLAKRPTALMTLREAAASDEAATRLVAIGALAEIDAQEVVPVLAHASSDPDESVRSAAIGYLSTRPGPEATSALLQRLLDPSTRERAIEALAVAADDRVDGVLTALETASADSAPVLMTALTRMRRPSSHAAMAAALAFDNVHARRAAASSLAAIGTLEAREALQRATSDPDPVVRRVCASAAIRR